jgi:hypothetical protein
VETCSGATLFVREYEPPCLGSRDGVTAGGGGVAAASAAPGGRGDADEDVGLDDGVVITGGPGGVWLRGSCSGREGGVVGAVELDGG